MKRRHLLQAGPLGVLAAGMGSLGPSSTGASPAGGSTAAFRTAAHQDHRCQVHPHRACRTPAGRSQGLDQRTELYGLGCATFTQRIRTVQTAVDVYLKQFLVGKSPWDIEDIWQSSFFSSYWRNGPVLNNALGGVDSALLGHSGEMDRPARLSVVGRQEPPRGGHLQVGRRPDLRRACRFVPAVAGAGLSAHSLRASGAGSLSSGRSGKRRPSRQPADTPLGGGPLRPGASPVSSGSCANGSANRSSC